jgi:hypothetical protein
MISSLRRDWPAAVLLLMTAVFIVPVWCVCSPGMPDYPAHLAGFQLIAAGAKGPLATFYSIKWMLLPNLASEMLVPFFAQLLPIEVAAKLFVSLSVAMWVLGPALIQRALTGKIGAAPLAGALFAYNANFTWGFFNYYFAAGFCFLIFAAWIAAKKKSPFRLVLFALAVFALYVCHLFAACLLAALIGIYEVSALLRENNFATKAVLTRAVPLAAAFLPTLLVFAAFKSHGGGDGGIEFNFADTIGDRFASAAQWSFSDPAYLVIGGLAILILAGLIYGKLRLHPAMKLTVLVLAVLTLVAPEWALGGWGVDLRLPPVLGAITFASLELRLDKRLAAMAGALVLLVAVGNAATLTADWVARDRQYGEFRAAIRDLKPGVRLFTILDGDALDDISDQPYWHMAEFAIVDRAGFTPLMFTTKGQHVIQLKPPYDRIAAATAQQGSPPDVTELTDLALGREENDPDITEVFPYLKYFQCHFDAAVVVHGGGEQADVPDFMSLHHTGSFFTLYDIHPTRICKKKP